MDYASNPGIWVTESEHLKSQDNLKKLVIQNLKIRNRFYEQPYWSYSESVWEDEFGEAVYHRWGVFANSSKINVNPILTLKLQEPCLTNL